MSAGVVNLVSDTQTRPTEGMRQAMAGAEVGDEQKLADPTTTALQERVAELLGHEAALFLPSGTMCNLISCRLHLGPAGEEIILAANSHVASFEAGGAGAISHAMTRQIDAPTGIYSGAQVEAAVRPAGDRYSPNSAMVSVEQTTNMGGGRVWPLAAVREVLEVARVARPARPPRRRAPDERVGGLGRRSGRLRRRLRHRVAGLQQGARRAGGRRAGVVRPS